MEVNHIKDLTPDPQNARKHNPRNIGMIERSLQEVGAARSIVIDENNRILAGNGTIEAAASAGIENVRVIETDGNEIIAVRRTGLTDEQKIKLALYDNRTAELALWDVEVLKMNQDFLDNLFDTKELTDMMSQDIVGKEYDEQIADGIVVCKCDRCGHEHSAKV